MNGVLRHSAKEVNETCADKIVIHMRAVGAAAAVAVGAARIAIMDTTGTQWGWE